MASFTNWRKSNSSRGRRPGVSEAGVSFAFADGDLVVTMERDNDGVQEKSVLRFGPDEIAAMTSVVASAQAVTVEDIEL